MLEAVFIEGIFAHAGDFQPDGAPTDMEAKVGAPGGTRVGGLEVAAEAAIPEAAGGDDLVLGVLTLPELIVDFAYEGVSLFVSGSFLQQTVDHGGWACSSEA